MAIELKTNVLYYGDNLDILNKHIPDNSVDLIYLDPLFNSKKDYNILFKENGGLESEAQVKAFGDSWHWTQAAQYTYQEIVTKAPKIKKYDAEQSNMIYIRKNPLNKSEKIKDAQQLLFHGTD